MSLANGYADGLDEEERLDIEAELAEGFADIEERSVTWSAVGRRADRTRFAVDAQQGVENVIVVDNVPIVDESKKQRLVERLRQVFDRAGAGIEEDHISMPWDDEKGTNKGCVLQLWVWSELMSQLPLPYLPRRTAGRERAPGARWGSVR